MITQIESERLLIISDIHLGNPFCKARARTIDFLKWAEKNEYDVCINGDGFEIAQVSFTKIARDVPDVFHAMKTFTNNGRNLYYIVGNHDIAFEHFLNDWGGFRVAPFLNLTSGDRRIRIEHGHLYDPFFVKNPELYEFATWFAGFFLSINPKLYKLWIWIEKLISLSFPHQDKGIVGEHPAFMEAARELTRRGFDTVVFGHTHHLGHVDLGDRKNYYNSGSWLIGSEYLEVKQGQVTLRDWDSDRNLHVLPQPKEKAS